MNLVSLIFDIFEARKIDRIVACRRLKSRENPPDVHSAKDRIGVDGLSIEYAEISTETFV